MPSDCSWIKDMVTLFETWPQVGGVGPLLGGI